MVYDNRDYLSEVRAFKHKMKEQQHDAFILGLVYGSTCMAISVMAILLFVYY